MLRKNTLQLFRFAMLQSLENLKNVVQSIKAANRDQGFFTKSPVYNMGRGQQKNQQNLLKILIYHFD